MEATLFQQCCGIFITVDLLLLSCKRNPKDYPHRSWCKHVQPLEKILPGKKTQYPKNRSTKSQQALAKPLYFLVSLGLIPLCYLF
jgi:hypothetical protein